MSKEKDTTINELAIMVQTGFNDVTSKMATKIELGEVNKRLDKIDKRLENLEDKQDKEITEIQQRMRTVEAALES